MSKIKYIWLKLIGWNCSSQSLIVGVIYFDYGIRFVHIIISHWMIHIAFIKEHHILINFHSILSNVSTTNLVIKLLLEIMEMITIVQAQELFGEVSLNWNRSIELIESESEEYFVSDSMGSSDIKDASCHLTLLLLKLEWLLSTTCVVAVLRKCRRCKYILTILK